MFGAHWLWLAAVLAGPCQAVPRFSGQVAGHVVHEKRAPSDIWTRFRRVERSAILPVRVGLTQTNLDKGHDLLMELSHPESPTYGQWLTPEAVHDFFAPEAETVEMVKSWIMSVGIADHRIVHHDNKGWLAVDATVEEAEALLKTTFYEFQHNSKDVLSVGADIYHIPEHLVPHIDYVTPGAKLVTIRKRDVTSKYNLRREAKRSISGDTMNALSHNGDGDVENHSGTSPGTNAVPAAAQDAPQLDPSLLNCTNNFTVTCARALYQIPEFSHAVGCNELGVFSTGDYISKADLDLYYANFAQWVPQGTYPIPALINGAKYDYPQNDIENVSGEANLDISLTTAMIYPQRVVIYQVDDPIYAKASLDSNVTMGFFNTFLDALDGSYCSYSAYGQTGNDPNLDPKYPNPDPAGYQGELMCGVFRPTKVITTSYGYMEDVLPWNYQKRQCNEWMKLSLMGTTMITGSGDDGVSGNPQIHPNNGCQGPNGNIFTTSAPNNCAYVLSVGATMQDRNETILVPERVLNYDIGGRNLTSGGGFSNIQIMPEYQKAAVQRYLDNYAPDYPYYEQLEPDFSKVQGLYNRIGRAYPDVSAHGIRYMFYDNGERAKLWGTSTSAPLFASILTLLNQEREIAGKGPVGFVNQVFYNHPEIFTDIVDGNNLGCGTNGFPAAPGWDLATGLGTPNYPKMRDLFLSLP